jgi:hypothetical protein
MNYWKEFKKWFASNIEQHEFFGVDQSLNEMVKDAKSWFNCELVEVDPAVFECFVTAPERFVADKMGINGISVDFTEFYDNGAIQIGEAWRLVHYDNALIIEKGAVFPEVILKRYEDHAKFNEWVEATMKRWQDRLNQLNVSIYALTNFRKHG